MTTTRALRLLQNNAETVNLVFKDTDNLDPVSGRALPLDITGKTIEFHAKATSETDDSAAMFLYSTAGGSPAITVTNGPDGEAEMQVAAADIADDGEFWYHCDVITGLSRKTAGKGPLIVDPV